MSTTNQKKKIIIKLLERQPLIIKGNNNKNMDQQRYGMLCNHTTRKALGNSRSRMGGY
jgi:hypothetical protein